MKNIIKIFLILAFIIPHTIFSQQLVQNIHELHKLKENEQQFINKPLRNLLQELKPEIKTVVENNSNPYYFNFRFTTVEQQQRNEGNIDDRVSLYVYVKDSFNWDERPKGKEFLWTNKDIEKYGDLIVIKIKIVQKK
jgi:hypothetical protein